MGIELICDVCQAPMCAFTHRADGSKICVRCRSIERVGKPEEKVFRALGVLSSWYRGYALDSIARPLFVLRDRGLQGKTRALIQHDRILRGEE